MGLLSLAIWTPIFFGAVLLALGHDPAAASEKLGVTVNTIRTHLKRMFDRTGTHSQSALVSTLLSAEAPTGR